MSFFKRRVVVTGLGAVTPIGTSLEEFNQNLKKGISGQGPIKSFDASDFPVKRAFEVKNFNAKKYGTHLMDPFIQYAVHATAEALEKANFDTEQYDPFEIGIAVSSSKGGVHTIDRFKERFEKNPSAILGARIYTNAVPNFAAQWIARRWRLKGPAKCYVSACATGTSAIIEGAQMVADGQVNYCIAGASDASIVPLMLAGYRKMKVLSSKDIRPFDQKRDGFLVGEGAGIVFLETLESAQARGAKIYGEILSFAYGQESSDTIRFDPEGDAIARTVVEARDRAELKTEDIDYINLHGTGTYEGDLYETAQLKKAFGQKAYDLSMSSIKSMTGHMLGASGAVEIVASLCAMNENFIPPTIGLENPGEGCDLNYTPQKSQEKEVRHALSFSAGFGGHIAAIVLGKTND